MKIKATQNVSYFTKDNIYLIIRESSTYYTFLDDRNQDRTICKDACNGEYAIILPIELNKQLKVL